MMDFLKVVWRMLRLTICILFVIVNINCTEGDNYSKPLLCENEWKSNISIAELQSLYPGETVRIQDNQFLEAYVISSDQEGNFFGSIHIQDLPDNPTAGLEVLIDLPDTHIFYPMGHRILIRLKGMYLGKDGEIFQLGGVSSFFGNQKVGRLPASLTEKHLQLGCADSYELVPKSISLQRLELENPGTYVEIDSVQFTEDIIGQPFAETEQETIRLLEDCYGNSIEVVNSGYADFAWTPLPAGSGKISGILLKDRGSLIIRINKLKEVKFIHERCPSGPDPITSDSLFLSEIADPDNNSEARFVELFNAGSDDLPLAGWTLERYTNDNPEAGSVIDLSDLMIRAGGTALIASNAAVFEEVFGFPPDLEGGKNSPADSNGDDNLILKDPFGVVKDIFGRIGEDGSNTDHEFEDGRALRKSEVSTGSTVYDPSEWYIFNDTGLVGTINQPQLAPDDFSPGIHNK
ncbi:DUF5689 domain-containing protein [Lentiprolixibacter aurantiacus]|uniref:DUF5689 domain-containing protein n=1 Tax=Lentiprolixibacter aurantiacus TaxID=2993939 RepID=A0AAE3MIA8_9FLAO|nr:DUF5689 domain-containing protein [Lentiprolixibacter aurantiacus]MCX2718315.1 DUF5689 domain-containing protein [Lentiprolixibacter aurantiacus]